MHNMILFRYRAPGLLPEQESRPKGCVRTPLRYIHCKQSAWFRGKKLLRATPPPSPLSRLSPPHLHLFADSLLLLNCGQVSSKLARVISNAFKVGTVRFILSVQVLFMME